jgi:hypothetical protein
MDYALRDRCNPCARTAWDARLSDESSFTQGRAVSRDQPPPDDSLAHHVAAALKRARDELLQRMARIGLTPERGWRVKEELRHTLEGTEWILSPIHMREASPQLEERVLIDGDGRLVSR